MIKWSLSIRSLAKENGLSKFSPSSIPRYSPHLSTAADLDVVADAAPTASPFLSAGKVADFDLPIQKNSLKPKDALAHLSNSADEPTRSVNTRPLSSLRRAKGSPTFQNHRVYHARDSAIDYYRGQITSILENPSFAPYRILSIMEKIEVLERESILNNTSEETQGFLMDMDLFNAKIQAQLTSKDRQGALKTLATMEERGVVPDLRTFEVLFQNIARMKASFTISRRLLNFMTRKYGLVPNVAIYFQLIFCVRSMCDLPRALQYYEAMKRLEDYQFDSELIGKLMLLAASRRMFPLLRNYLNDIEAHDASVKRLENQRKRRNDGPLHTASLSESKMSTKEIVFDTVLPFSVYQQVLLAIASTKNVDVVVRIMHQIKAFPLGDALYSVLLAMAERNGSLTLAILVFQSLLYHRSTGTIVLPSHYLTFFRTALGVGRLDIACHTLPEMQKRRIPVLLSDLQPLIHYLSRAGARLDHAEKLLEQHLHQVGGECLASPALLSSNKSFPAAFFYAVLLAHAYCGNTFVVSKMLSELSTFKIPVDLLHYHCLLTLDTIARQPRALLATIRRMAASGIPPTIETMKTILLGLFSCDDSPEDLAIAKDYLGRLLSQKSSSVLLTLTLTAEAKRLLAAIKEKNSLETSYPGPLGHGEDDMIQGETAGKKKKDIRSCCSNGSNH